LEVALVPMTAMQPPQAVALAAAVVLILVLELQGKVLMVDPAQDLLQLTRLVAVVVLTLLVVVFQDKLPVMVELVLVQVLLVHPLFTVAVEAVVVMAQEQPVLAEAVAVAMVLQVIQETELLVLQILAAAAAVVQIGLVVQDMVAQAVQS
jgi:hypothetical protein